MKLQKGDWALVTGASSGIGLAFSENLARRGINVVGIALEGPELKSFSSRMVALGVQTRALALDLSQAQSGQVLLNFLQQERIEIDLLLNAAGFGYFGEFESMTEELIERMVRVDILAVVSLCHLLLPSMKRRKRGAIINIASIAGRLPYPYAAVYSAAKSFVHVFTEALWAEMNQEGIAIIAISPGYTKTNFEKVSTEPDSIHLFPPETPEAIAEKTLNRLGRSGPSFFTHPTHALKVLGAKLLGLKNFARLLKHLMDKGRQEEVR